jgi:hypothetical protein
MALPPLLSSRTPAQQIVLANVVPALFGLVAGLMVGVSEVVYLVLALLGILGGYLAGLEHPTAADGATRGVVGGVLFGSFILFGHELTGSEAKAELPEPAILLVAITTIFGAALGALGGRSRRKRTPAAT